MSGLRPGFPLLDREAGAALFRTRDDVRTGADFLADANALARVLPDAPWLVNCCENRYWFAVVLAAGLLRGQPNLLAGDHAPATLAALGRRYPGALAVAEHALASCPLPMHDLMGHRLTMDRSGVAPEGGNPLIPGDRVAAIAFTSGTTGEPAAHVKPWGVLVERSRAAGACFGFTENAPVSIVGTVPPQHMYGFETTLLLPLHAAAASWSDTVFYPADVRDALAAVRAPRVLITTPLHLRALVEQAVPASSGSASPWPAPPDIVISATAPLTVTLAEAAERAWGTRVLEIFGATEVGSIASRRTTRDAHWTTYPGVSLRETPEGALIHAPWLDPHPLNDAIETLGAHGFRLLGRGGDIVKLGGRRASHAGLNHILTRIEGVEDGVFVVPDDLDDRPSARLTVLVVAPRRDAAAILAGLRGQIDPVFLPRRIIHVDALPRNAVGKLTRGALRALLDSLGRDGANQDAPGEDAVRGE